MATTTVSCGQDIEEDAQWLVKAPEIEKGASVAEIGAPASAAESEDNPPDLLNLEAGAVVLSQSSQYNEEWAALLLLDDTATRGWSAGEGADFPHEIVIELAQPSQLTSIAFDNSGALEADNPGISARNIEVWASTQGPEGAFKKILEGEVAQGARTRLRLPEPAKARWLKFVIISNWGHQQYTELMELEAYGEPLGVAGQPPELTGVYDTNYDLIRFEQDDTQVRGCYDFEGGTLTGSTDGRVVQFEWRENAGQDVGTAIMVLSHSGEQINGLWYRDANYEGLWLGSRAGAEERPDCTLPAINGLEQSLAESGRAILYGIRFDIDSAKLLPQSKTTLQQALAALNNHPELALIVEGHTDAVGTEAYNRDLSKRRASAVVDWLIEHGIEGKRLQARGYGESRPVSSNDTAQGRDLNRRVELKRHD